MKYHKKIRPRAVPGRRKDPFNEERRMNNPYRAEQLDFTTRIPRHRPYWDGGRGHGWRHMQRFFESRIGQSWSKVHKEFLSKCACWWLRADALGHGTVFPMIHECVAIQGGVVIRRSGRREGEPLDFNRLREMFVHPRTGQLCGAKTHARKQKRALRKDWRAAPIQA